MSAGDSPALKGMKALIRSTIQSVKGGIPARNLNRDFCNITGGAIPFQKHGFASLQDFLVSMPEVVCLTMKDGELYCCAVADETTAHIEKMISRQRSVKKSKKGGWGRMRRPTVTSRSKFGGFQFSSHATRSRPSSSYTGHYNTPRPTNTYNRPTSAPQRPASTVERQSQPQSGRTVAVSPRGTVKITAERSPLHRAAVNNMANKGTASPQPHKFGANSKVPPRLRKMANASPIPGDSFKDVREYKNLLYGYLGKHGHDCPRYETIYTSGGFTSIVTVKGQAHGSGGIYRTRPDAEQASAKSACQALGLVRAPKQDNLSDRDLDVVKQRIASLVKGKNNGLFLSRIPIVYKETFNEYPPSSINNLVRYWPDVVSVLDAQEGLVILYPVAKTEVPPASSSASRTSSQSRAAPTNYKRSTKTDHGHAPSKVPPPMHLQPDTSPRTKRRQLNTTILNPQLLSIQEPAMPDVGKTQNVYISYVADVSRFYVHMADSKITEIMQNLNEIYGGKRRYPISDLQCSAFVAAKCEDGYWYRAQILSLLPPSDPQECAIYYIDFGNTESMCTDRVQELQPKCYHWPIQALVCSLDGVFPCKDRTRWEGATKELKNFLESDCEIRIMSHKDGKCHVKLYADNKCVNEELQRKGLVRSAPIVQEPGPLELPSESEWEVTVTIVISANQIILRLLGEEYSDKLDELEEMISKTPVPTTVSIPEVGDLCAAMIDGSTEEGDIPWYRVCVKEVGQDKAKCECLDYGDLQEVPFSMLRPLRPEECELPFQAIVAYLGGLEGCEDSEDMKQRLIELALGKSLIANVESREGDPSITLYDTSTDKDIKINEALVLVSDIAMARPSLPELCGMCEVYLSHVDLEGNVYIQIQGPGLLELEVLSSQVSEKLSKGGAEYFVTELVEGRMVLAPFLDGGWYRGVILEVLPNRMVLLNFVDYGNQEVVACSSLREVDKASKKLFNLPPQAIPVTLDELPPQGYPWTEAAIDELCRLAPPENLVQVETVKEEKDGALSVVHLYNLVHNELMSINEELTDLKFWTEPQAESSTTSSGDNEADVNTSLSDASVASQQANEVLRETEGLFRDLGIADTSGLLSLNLKDSSTYPSDESARHPINTDLAPVCGTGENDLKFCPPSDSNETESGLASDVETRPGENLNVGIESSTDLNSNEIVNTSARTDADFAALPLPPALKLPSSGSEVYVTWAADPSNFRCVTSSRLAVIERMMDEMARFYYQEGNMLTVENLRIGGLYAGYHEDERWYRIRIKNIINQPLLSNTTMVSAQFVDFGDFYLLPASSLRHLPMGFRQLPYQVIQARLAGVEAEAGIWGEEAIRHFESLVLEKTMVAWLHGSDADSVVNMTLVDINSEGDDALVHKKLIKEGFAVSSPIPNV